MSVLLEYMYTFKGVPYAVKSLRFIGVAGDFIDVFTSLECRWAKMFPVLGVLGSHRNKQGSHTCTQITIFSTVSMSHKIMMEQSLLVFGELSSHPDKQASH